MDQGSSPEDIFKARNRVNNDPGARSAPGPGLSGPYSNHDMQIRNHLSGLVRAMLQDNKKAELREVLHAHRAFIDEILVLLEKQ
ncbi:MAG TPA: hypothetical protein PKE49_19960 [Leptospiraceae bacterium]|jgi:hypothetical protein|nr:hypothetical protein [Leptospirales bacterium]HMU83959.1 hypothetical protein [Leptospiraceae bacterium]HMX58812.1 hypothetical protein [Leptospiraceae bacterium]HMZ35347.1 hypothetical protein [Leptospiraceae bacterium]HNE25459.1 hypothetical protein [Leptospiraceae bacterium]